MKYSHDHDCPFEAYITNLGKYNEGYLIGEWVKFPATEDTLNAVFKRIGIGSEDAFGCPYEEWFITDYDCYVEGIYGVLGEYENLDTLNDLAEKLEDMDDETYEKFLAVCSDRCLMSLSDILEVIEDLDKYNILSDIKNAKDYGYYLIENGEYDLSSCPEIRNFIDYEKLGTENSMDGTFTDYGYIEEI